MTEKTTSTDSLGAASCCASSFSPEQIEQWLTHMESIASASPQMAAVIRMIRKDVQHPEDGIVAFFQHNAERRGPAAEDKR